MTTVSQIVRQCESLLAQCVIAANEAASAAASVSSAAPINSPLFTGMPEAPTPPQNSNNFLLATTAYFDRLLGTANGVATLDATGRIPTAELPSSVLGGLSYLGVWNGSTNTPTLASGSGTNGNFYICNVSGTATVSGNSTWSVGDWIVYDDGSDDTWHRVSPTYTTVTGITLSDLAAQAASTLVGNNGTGAASPTAIPISTITSLVPDMVGASGTAVGVRGLVPAPAAGDGVDPKYLTALGTWADAPTPNLSAYALLNGPAFTGSVTAPTIARGTSSTALATTEFVLKNMASATDMVPLADGTASCGTSTYGARIDHIHPTDASRASAASLAAYALLSTLSNYALTASLSAYALVNSPTFTGTPAAPTASPGTNTTQLATTGFVETAVAGVSVGQPIPTSAALPVGFAGTFYLSAGNIADEATVSGAGIQIYSGNPDIVGGGVQSGTWKNISGVTVSSGDGPGWGLFVRIS